MIATTNAGRPTIGRMAPRSITRAMAAVARAAIPRERKKVNPVKIRKPIAGAM